MKVQSWEEARASIEEARKDGEVVVFTNGCFDILHSGHIQCLRSAKELGDRLLVAVNSDSSVRENKGEGRPVNSQEERAELLAALEFVDYVIVFGEKDPSRAISFLRPDVLVKGADWEPDRIIGREEVEGWGGKVVTIPLVRGKSTSEILKRIKESTAQQET